MRATYVRGCTPAGGAWGSAPRPNVAGSVPSVSVPSSAPSNVSVKSVAFAVVARTRFQSL